MGTHGLMEQNKLFSLFLLLFLSTDVGQAIQPTAKVEIESTMTYRYVRTLVKSTIKNQDLEPQEVTFAMVLPEIAFISNFSILADGKEHVARVMDATLAKEKYNNATKIGYGTGMVNQLPNDRTFNISVNVEAKQEISLYLTYEERLERENGFYKYRIHLETLHNIESLKVTVALKETQPLTNLCVPLNNEAKSCEGVTLPSQVQLDWSKGRNEARVLYEPSDTRALEKGLNILYSVDCPKNEIQVVCGHFIHTLCTDTLPRPKHVVFVLDTSGSMSWMERLKKLKDAMFSLLDNTLKKGDYFSIINFASGVEELTENNNNIFEATARNIRKAKIHVNKLKAYGGTNINSALLRALELTAKSTNIIKKDTTRMIVFLTDGDPTSGETNVDKIVRNIHDKNTEKVPILSLGFGTDADFKLLQRISAMTDSLSKMIYDGSEAALQLENFFYRTSRPTLSNVRLRYMGNVDQTSITEQRTGQMFQGEERVTMGRTQGGVEPLEVEMTADSRDGKVTTRTELLGESSDTNVNIW